MYVVKFSLLYAAFVLGVFILLHADWANDYDQYLALSAWTTAPVSVNGEFVTIQEPFASRVLGPLLVHWLSGRSGWPRERVFEFLDLAVWLSLGPIIGRYLWGQGVAFADAAIVATLPYPAIAATRYIIPDALSAALLLLVVLGLERGKLVVPALATALQMLARNTSLLTIIVWLAARRDKIGLARAGAILAAAAAGLICLKFVRVSQADNMHQMNSFVYLLLKIPVNYFRNTFSIDFVTGNAKFDCHNPFVTFDLSRLHFLGTIKQLGLCKPDLVRTALTAATMLFALGVFPFIALAKARSRLIHGGDMKSELRLHGPEWSFLLFFFLIPGLGTAVPRLAMDAFVLLISVAPLILTPDTDQTRRFVPYFAYNMIGVVVMGFCETLW